jgi:tRNA threonylcarbamoyladenosine biosynthesis protein TsaB
MKILALDTSSSQCSVALLTAGSMLERSQTAARIHAEMILPMLESLLLEADVPLKQLDALAFGRGPGGFTGVRVATSVVQGLAFGLQLQVLPISDLMAVAAAAYRLHGQKNVLACIDARMGQVYWCAYETENGEDFTACTPETLSPPEFVKLPDGISWFGSGSGFDLYKEMLVTRLGLSFSEQCVTLLPTARDIAALARISLARGQAVSADAALPVYLRDRVAWPKSAL